MALRVSDEEINLKVQIIKDALREDFIDESHNQAQSVINIKINNNYGIYKCILVNLEYNPYDKKNPGKFTWYFN